MGLISIVVPVLNEQECLGPLFERLNRLNAAVDQHEFIFVDDGSTDRSRQIILDLARRYARVKYLFFSRNFGHEAATTAGIDYAGGDAIVIIDADLQDPPELIPQLVEKWREGFQIVYARRIHRDGESLWKLATSWLFYRFIRRLSDVDIPPDTGDFRLIDRCVADHFRQCREQSRFVRGLLAWTGFRQVAVPYQRHERFAGQTKYSVLKLTRLALDAVIGFSNLPLRLGVLAGLVVCLLSLVMMLVVIVQKVLWNTPMPGYTLLATGIFFLGGVQLSIMGLLGEYVGRIYREAQGRPLYIVMDKSRSLPAGEAGTTAEATPEELPAAKTAGTTEIAARAA